MGLLDYLTAHSMDEDYAQVSRRRGTRAEPRRVRPGVAALVVVAVFGLLVGTAAVQTSRNAVASEGAREELVGQIEARSAEVEAMRERAVDLRGDVETLETQFLESTAQGRSVSDRLDRLGANTGWLGVTGPGVVVVVDDAPGATSAQQEVLDKDLQKLVNGLWAAGAEAVSVNGERLSNLTAIRNAGSAITVNYRSLSRPYVVSAIGDPNSIPARFVEHDHGAAWLDLQASFGLQFDMTTEEFLSLPAADRINLRQATTAESPR